MSEYKVDFLAPAQGERMLARGRVLRPGRAVTVCAGDVVAIDDGKEKLVATMLATMTTVHSERREIEAVGSRQIALADADIHALFGPSEDGMMQRVLPSPVTPDYTLTSLDELSRRIARLWPEAVTWAEDVLPSRSTVTVEFRPCLIDHDETLLCLDRDQRVVYILGEIFDVTDAVGAELLETSRENFRQRLARARRDLHTFMNDKCGLVNQANPCRCARKTQAFIRCGHVDPGNLLFARDRVQQVRDVAPRKADALATLDAQCAEIFRQHPFAEPEDLVPELRRLIDSAEFRRATEPS